MLYVHSTSKSPFHNMNSIISAPQETLIYNHITGNNLFIVHKKKYNLEHLI